MRKTIVVNGRVLTPAEMTFNNVCRMEELGAPITDAENRSMNFLRAYLAVCLGSNAEVAGAELEAHVLGGGSMTELSEVLAEAMDESDFFQALSKRTEAEVTEIEKPKKK